jgi:hypothetical protein
MNWHVVKTKKQHGGFLGRGTVAGWERFILAVHRPRGELSLRLIHEKNISAVLAIGIVTAVFLDRSEVGIGLQITKFEQRTQAYIAELKRSICTDRSLEDRYKRHCLRISWGK